MYIILGLIVLAAVGVKLALMKLGLEEVVLQEESPWEKVSQDEESLILQKKLTFVNKGPQCATFMDAFVRSGLPYEQYDGIEVIAKAEREGYPREDEYFEAVLIQKAGANGDKLSIYVKVCLLPRKNLTLRGALSHMVDLPIDFIWQETGRRPWHYNKIRLTATAAELAKMADVTLIQD
ncbi:MAG: hypothetical protein IJ849_03610 [Selenomonadaceae bacterium]|nr:hypothetical protein [Selenomonadaceae bacterium]